MCQEGSVLFHRILKYTFNIQSIRLITCSTNQIFGHIAKKYCNSIKYQPNLFLQTLPLQHYQCRFLTEGVSKCWKCGIINNDMSLLFCKHCEVLQKPDPNHNFFHIIGIDTKYEVETATLTRNYHKLQNVLHPDRFSNRHEEEIKISEEYSSLVNKAYFTLLQPLSRGLYMLEMKGIFIEEAKNESSLEFLMEMMEENEKVDAARDPHTLRELSSQNKSSLTKLEKEVAEAFDNGNLKQAEAAIIKMKYYSSIATKIKDIKQKKGIED